MICVSLKQKVLLRIETCFRTLASTYIDNQAAVQIHNDCLIYIYFSNSKLINIYILHTIYRRRAMMTKKEK